MLNRISKGLRLFAGIIIAATFVFQASAADAQTKSQGGRDKGQYIPTIWVDPDGCEHWVMDDGAEGYMTPNVSRQGIPVCRRGNVCGVMNTDQFFATDSYRIHAQGKQRLAQFFKSTGAIPISSAATQTAAHLMNTTCACRSTVRMPLLLLPHKPARGSQMYADMANVCPLHQTGRPPAWPRTAVSKSSAFAKGTEQCLKQKSYWSQPAPLA